jgi:hypothetical protein
LARIWLEGELLFMERWISRPLAENSWPRLGVNAETDTDDPYACFQIPDDLMCQLRLASRGKTRKEIQCLYRGGGRDEWRAAASTTMGTGE